MPNARKLSAWFRNASPTTRRRRANRPRSRRAGRPKPTAIEAGLPADVVALLDGSDLHARVGFTLELITTGADGWPGVALLSAGEVLAISDSELRLALWPDSRTTANLTRSGQGVLAFVHDGAAFTVRLEVERTGDVAGPLAAFDGRAAGVRRDEVDYARLTSGITFELPDTPAVLARWRETIEALRSL